MVNLVPAKCPNCGAQLELDDNMKRAECSFCKSTIIVDNAIAKYKVEISGEVKVDGIVGKEELLKNAESKIKVGRYDDGFKDYRDYWDKYPSDENGYLSYLNLLMSDNDFQNKEKDKLNELALFGKLQEKNMFLKIATNESKNRFLEEFDKFEEELRKKTTPRMIFNHNYISLGKFEEKYKSKFTQAIKDQYGLYDERLDVLNDYSYLQLLDVFDNIKIVAYKSSIYGGSSKSGEYTYDKNKHSLISANKEINLCSECKSSLFGSNTFSYVDFIPRDIGFLGINKSVLYVTATIDNHKKSQWDHQFDDEKVDEYILEITVPDFESINLIELKNKLSGIETIKQAKENAKSFNSKAEKIGFERVLKLKGLRHTDITQSGIDESLVKAIEIYSNGICLFMYNLTERKSFGKDSISVKTICFKISSSLISKYIV